MKTLNINTGKSVSNVFVRKLTTKQNFEMANIIVHSCLNCELNEFTDSTNNLTYIGALYAIGTKKGMIIKIFVDDVEISWADFIANQIKLYDELLIKYAE